MAKSNKLAALGGGNSVDVPNAEPWPEHCPPPQMVDAMLLLQERWVLFIVQALLIEPLGFNEIGRRATGVSTATLSQRLDMLEHRGVVTRRVISSSPPRTEYRLTPTGDALGPVLDAIAAWSETSPLEPARGAVKR